MTKELGTVSAGSARGRQPSRLSREGPGGPPAPPGAVRKFSGGLPHPLKRGARGPGETYALISLGDPPPSLR